MFERGNQNDGSVNDGEARGDRHPDDELDQLTDRDFGLDEEDPADRRRDPLRKP
jgi:hypothetical protein